MKTSSKIGVYMFIVSMLLLVGNDWYAKQAFHNTLTGKLSDVAGLFALPFLLGVWRPRWALTLHLGCAVLFIYWKSAFAQPFIN